MKPAPVLPPSTKTGPAMDPTDGMPWAPYKQPADPTFYAQLVQEYPEVKLVLDIMPLTGSTMSLADALEAARQGEFGEAAMEAIGAIPLVKYGMLIKHVRGWDDFTTSMFSRGRRMADSTRAARLFDNARDTDDYLSARSLDPQTMQNYFNDMPPALTSIYNPAQMPTPISGLSSGMSGPQTFIPSYQMGGMVGPGGMPEPMGMPPGMPPGMPAAQGVGLAEPGMGGEQISPDMLRMHVQEFISNHPQEVEQIKQGVIEQLEAGELALEDLQMLSQLTKVVSQNPEMYPYVRNFAIQQGLIDEDMFPQEYDQGLMFTLMVISELYDQEMAAEEQMMPEQVPTMAMGGEVPPSRKSNGSVLINAHENEYVIPANVVKMKGKEFFDNLVEKYREQ